MLFLEIHTTFHGFPLALFAVCSPKTIKIVPFYSENCVVRELTEPATAVVSRSRKEDF